MWRVAETQRGAGVGVVWFRSLEAERGVLPEYSMVLVQG